MTGICVNLKDLNYVNIPASQIEPYIEKQSFIIQISGIGTNKIKSSFLVTKNEEFDEEDSDNYSIKYLQQQQCVETTCKNKLIELIYSNSGSSFQIRKSHDAENGYYLIEIYNDETSEFIKKKSIDRKENFLLPSNEELYNICKNNANLLYTAWKKELAYRIHNLEFCGIIDSSHINVSSVVWRLPNNFIRDALRKLEDELEKLGYDYEFKFGDVQDSNFILYYEIDPPECDDDESITDDSSNIYVNVTLNGNEWENIENESINTNTTSIYQISIYPVNNLWNNHNKASTFFIWKFDTNQNAKIQEIKGNEHLFEVEWLADENIKIRKMNKDHDGDYQIQFVCISNSIDQRTNTKYEKISDISDTDSITSLLNHE